MKRMAWAAAAAAAGLATTASAGNLPTGGVTAQEVAKELQAKGYKAEVSKDSEGDPMIVSALDGSNFRVFFYNCKSGRCASIQYVIAFDFKDGLKHPIINDWNRQKRFGRAFLDDEMDPVLQYDVDMEVGATSEAIGNTVDVWAAVVPTFKTFVDF